MAVEEWKETHSDEEIMRSDHIALGPGRMTSVVLPLPSPSV